MRINLINSYLYEYQHFSKGLKDFSIEFRIFYFLFNFIVRGEGGGEGVGSNTTFGKFLQNFFLIKKIFLNTFRWIFKC